MKREWNEKVDVNGEFWKDEKKYLVVKGFDTSGTIYRSPKHLIIVSHSDLDGVTSALNMMMYAEARKIDYDVYMERTSREEETSKICKYAVKEVLDRYKVIPYIVDIEVVITDRMFLDLKTFDANDYPDNVKFSWYDHHSGNVRTRDEIVAVIGEERLNDYNVLTDVEHCGATISYEACYNRLKSEAEIQDYQLYERNLRAWSRNVNLWDTFLWKKKYTPNEPQFYRGQKWGTIDKVVEGEQELLKTLLGFIDSGLSLDSNEVYNWVNDCWNIYQAMSDEAYNRARDHKLCGFITFYKEQPVTEELIYEGVQPEDIAYKIAVVPAEWKFASNIKERLMAEYPDTDVVITFHKTGGTVYTSYELEDFESPELARFIGETYGLSGGGHKNAAGFSCRRDTKESIYDDETRDRIALRIVFERIGLALNEFITTRFKEVYSEWKI